MKKQIQLKRIAKEVYDRVQAGEDLWVILDEIELKYVDFMAFYTAFIRLTMGNFKEGLQMLGFGQ